MKKIYSLFVFITISLTALAQQTDTIQPRDSSWKKGGFIHLNFTQVKLNKWTQGGENSYALASAAHLFADYERGHTTWENSLDLAFALQQSGDQKARKNDDRIDLTSKYGKLMTGRWYYSALINFKSQMTNGYYYPDDSTVISKFLSPGYLTISLGLNYKPKNGFKMFVSPFAARITFVTDQALADIGAYGVEPAAVDADGYYIEGTGKKIKKEFGAYLNAKYKKEIMQNVVLLTRLELFNDYTSKNKNDRTNVDVDWETSLTMKINKLLNATMIVRVLYDDNVIPRTQIIEVIGIGLGYKF